MTKPTPSFTMAGLLASLKEHMPQIATEGATTPEVAAAWGIAEQTALRRMKELMVEGHVTRGVTVRANIDGVRGRRPCWKLTEEETNETD